MAKEIDFNEVNENVYYDLSILLEWVKSKCKEFNIPY